MRDDHDAAIRDRHDGALFGLAVGDAVGTTLEFRPPGTFEPITDLTGGGPFGLLPGRWTDDTSMALCLAESLVERGGFDALDQMRRYVRWWRRGHLSSTGACFDIGNTVVAALRRFEQTDDPFAGSDDPRSAGNGSLMRLAPVPMAYGPLLDHDPSAFEQVAADAGRTTHAAAEAVDACRAFARLVAVAIARPTLSRDELLEAAASAAPPLSPRVAAVVAGSFRKKSPPHIRGTGYVVDCLEAALWAFHATRDYRACVLAAANLGDDADTTAAVAGQLAGAFYGKRSIPAAWRKRLALPQVIGGLCDGLWSLRCELSPDSEM